MAANDETAALGADFGTISNPLDTRPPVRLVERKMFVQANGAVNTIRLPNDPLHAEKERWFSPGGATDTAGNSMPPVRAGGEVTFLIDGGSFGDDNAQAGSQTLRTYALMQQHIQKANAPGDFIYLLNWWYEDDYAIAGGETMRTLLQAASDKGVEIRAMFWLQKELSFGLALHYLLPVVDFFLPDDPIPGLIDKAINFVGDTESLGFTSEKHNQRGAAHINLMKKGAAIIDDRTLDFGSHHQKILIVKHGDEIVAFCGGIDFNLDRLNAKANPNSSSGGFGQPLHDVHCLVRGTAAIDLLRTFVQRWEEYPKPDISALDIMLKGVDDLLEKAIAGQITEILGKISAPILGSAIIKKRRPTTKTLLTTTRSTRPATSSSRSRAPSATAATTRALTTQTFRSKTFSTKYRASICLPTSRMPACIFSRPKATTSRPKASRRLAPC